MDTTSFATSLWAEIKTLSLDDTDFYIKNTQSLLRPEGRIALIHTSPESYNVNALQATLHLHRYSFMRSPHDISRGSVIMLNYISLAEQPGYAYFFFTLASRSLDLFERTTQIDYLDHAVALLEYFHEAQEPRSNICAMAALVASCACMQYYLKAGEIQARDSALRYLEEMRERSSALGWSSPLTRTLVVIAHVIRHRYVNLDPQEDLNQSLQTLKFILDTILVLDRHQFSSLQILVISIIFVLSKDPDNDTWETSLHALLQAVYLQLSSRPPKLNDSPPSKDGLGLLSLAIDRCSTPSSAHLPLCLIHISDVLDSGGNDPQVEVSLEDLKADSKWSMEWGAALLHFRRTVQYFDSGLTPKDEVPHQIFQPFMVHGKCEHRPNLGRVIYRALDPYEAHTCIFKLTIISVDNGLDEFGAPEDLTHVTFCRYFQLLCQHLSSEELDHLIDHPNELGQLFSRYKELKGTDKPLANWKQSPSLMAYLLFQRGGNALKSLERAAQTLLTVRLDSEPGHCHFFYQLGASLRDFESDIAAIGRASRLIKEFLRVQNRGSAKHFLGMIELASTFAIDFLNRQTRLPSFIVALELFREAVKSRTTGPWIINGRKVVVLGRILHNRYRHFAESEECLERTINEFTTLWDILPVGSPYRASTLEIILISAMLDMSVVLDTNNWLKALKYLTLAVGLYLNGTEPNEECVDAKEAANIVEVLLAGGIDVTFSFASRAMCLVHLGDMLRTIAADICHNPGFLRLSLALYERSLKAQPESDTPREKQILSSSWESEKAGLRCAILALTQRDRSAPTSALVNRGFLSIFEYRAVYMTSSHNPRSYNHSCILHYYPTWVSYLPEQEPDSESTSTNSDNCSPSISLPPWPDDLTSLPTSSTGPKISQDRQILPSTVVPGFEKFIQDEGHELFKMPLELRTIRAFIRSIDSEVRGLEKLSSHLSEKLVRQSSEVIYWNPKQIELGARMAKLKANSPYLARLAPLQALLSRGPERCLELVESSRTLFWNRLLRLQTSFAGLPDDLARSLESAAQELDKCKSQFSASASKEELQWQYDLESIFTRLLSQARQVPGFENLLMPKNYEMLMKASSGGPVIVLLGIDSTYAALIVRPSGIDSIFLSDLTDQAVEKLVVGLNRASKSARSILQDQGDDSDSTTARYGRPSKSPLMPSYDTFLDAMWKLIVKPIFEFMGLLANPKPAEERPRLWWCPTGRFAFLPVHAAGNNIGRADVESVSKYVVSSYIPTLSALLNVRKKTEKSSILVSDLNTLVLAQPKTPGHNNLPMTIKEIELLETLIPPTLLLHVEEGPLSQSNINRTVDEATKYLADASILHLACHGHQDQADPLNSGFQLSDGRLSLSKIISCRNPNAFLAYLSACESAANDVDVPDESLSLAAAMLFAGFRSVIGTMWSMNDKDGPEVAQSIYEELFRNPDRVLDPKLIPYALDSAIRKLQQKGIHASRWATYIHVGM